MKHVHARKPLFERDASGLASFSAQVPCEEEGGWNALGNGAHAGASTASGAGWDRTRFGVEKEEKKTIFFSRDYRYLKRPSGLSMVISLLLVALVVAFYIINYSAITNALCAWAGKVVSEVANTSAYTVSTSFVPNRGQMYYLAVDSTYPSYPLLIATAVVCILLAVFSIQDVKNTLPVGIYVCMGSYLALISVLFFLFSPDAFPYTLTQYSELYMKQQLVLWIFIPLVGALAVFMVDKKPSAALLAFIIITVVSFVFGCVRYPIFLVILHMGSSLFMAPLFFTLGVLFDFLQMISVYVIYVRYMSRHLNSFEHREEWQW